MDNPQITPADVITDVESRFSSVPSISSTVYLPWISYAYQRLYQKICEVSQTAKENLFGEVAEVDLPTSTPSEFTITDEIPRFGGFIAVEVKYGGTGDVYNKASLLKSVAHWTNWDNISTNYRSKVTPLYYQRGKTMGFIPVPPEVNAVAKIWYVKRPYQITSVTDVIDIPYRFLTPLFDFVHARALQKVNEDYGNAGAIEANFRGQLDEIQLAVASEFNENDGTDNVQDNTNSGFYDNPLKW